MTYRGSHVLTEHDLHYVDDVAIGIDVGDTWGWWVKEGENISGLLIGAGAHCHLLRSSQVWSEWHNADSITL